MGQGRTESWKKLFFEDPYHFPTCLCCLQTTYYCALFTFILTKWPMYKLISELTRKSSPLLFFLTLLFLLVSLYSWSGVIKLRDKCNFFDQVETFPTYVDTSLPQFVPPRLSFYLFTSTQVYGLHCVTCWFRCETFLKLLICFIF